MSDRLVSLTCASFAEALAAREPVPGGGGAAALTAALAAALGSMVGNFTVGKQAYANVEGDVRRMLAELAAARMRLLALVDEDAAAFEPLSRAYAIPRGDPARADVLEAATQAACAAPLEMMRQTVRTIDLLVEMGEKGSRMLVSDVACGLALARAALEAASVNIYVNTRALKDDGAVRALEAPCDELLATYVPKAERALAAITSLLRA